MRPFYFFRRDNGVIYVQFPNEAMHKRTTARSTRETNAARAMTVVCDWMKNGIPLRGNRQQVETSVAIHNLVDLFSGNKLKETDILKLTEVMTKYGFGITNRTQEARSKTGLTVFLEHFCEYEHNPYVRDKLAHGYDIGKRYCADMVKRVKYWNEHFKDSYFEDVTTEELRKFETFLMEKRLAGATRNYILLAGKTAYEWVHANKKFAENPCVGLKRYNAKKTAKDRNVFTVVEAKGLFKAVWNDERARVASLVAMTTGLRQGEIRALRSCDIGPGRGEAGDGGVPGEDGLDRFVPPGMLYRGQIGVPAGAVEGPLLLVRVLVREELGTAVHAADLRDTSAEHGGRQGPG